MTAQEEFDRVYITSSEICQTLSVTRSAIVNGRRRGLLPDPIRINGAQILVWKRDSVQPFLDAWDINLKARRGELTS